jgi:hypothetical protein
MIDSARTQLRPSHFGNAFRLVWAATGVSNLGDGITLVALPLLALIAQERLGLDATAFGALLAIGAAGGVIGALTAPQISTITSMRTSGVRKA